MKRCRKKRSFLRKGRLNILFFLIISGVIIAILPFFELNPEAELAQENFSLAEKLIIVQGNSLLGIAQPSNPQSKMVRRMSVVITGYSSSPWETDDDPHITAAGTWVREGIVANNLLPFGTKIRIPEIYGERVFVVEDRMNWKKGNYQIDIWFPDYWQALNFGVKRTYIEILEG